MPKLNGYAVIKALREDSTKAKIPFIFLTAQTSVTVPALQHNWDLMII